MTVPHGRCEENRPGVHASHPHAVKQATNSDDFSWLKMSEYNLACGGPKFCEIFGGAALKQRAFALACSTPFSKVLVEQQNASFCP